MNTNELDPTESNASLDYNDFQEIIPALDFINEHAYVAIPKRDVTDKGMVTSYQLIRSDGKAIGLKPPYTELMALKLYSERMPAPEARWSNTSLQEFLSTHGESSYQDISKVIADLVAILKKYIDFEDDRLIYLISCWTIATYFHRVFVAFPYLHLNGNAGSGKTKTLIILSLLAFNAELSASNTPAYTIRIIHSNSATLLLDEVETLKRPKDEDVKTIVAILNSGYKKGARVGKAEQIGKSQLWTPKKYDAYSPKVFAGIQGLDATLASRCIPITMVNSSNNTIKNVEVYEQDAHWPKLRDACYWLLMKEHKAVRRHYSQLSDTELVGREWELWKPLLTIAQLADESVYQQVRSLALEIHQQKQEATIEDMETPKILMALEALLQTKFGDSCCSLQEIVDFVVEYDHEHFGWLKEPYKQLRPTRWMGQQLRRAGVVSGTSRPIRMGGKVARGFDLKLQVIQQRLKNYAADGYMVTDDENTPPVSTNVSVTEPVTPD
ncbi:MAG: DUF3631 domain-containing protein [Candidatus Kerfeldbacteria bacterium]|nr:DUF3631 domain-containing protein [Candidatus Kerfeldbacteria bacterium]